MWASCTVLTLVIFTPWLSSRVYTQINAHCVDSNAFIKKNPMCCWLLFTKHVTGTAQAHVSNSFRHTRAQSLHTKLLRESLTLFPSWSVSQPSYCSSTENIDYSLLTLYYLHNCNSDYWAFFHNGKLGFLTNHFKIKQQ